MSKLYAGSKTLCVTTTCMSIFLTGTIYKKVSKKETPRTEECDG